MKVEMEHGGQEGEFDTMEEAMGFIATTYRLDNLGTYEGDDGVTFVYTSQGAADADDCGFANSEGLIARIYPHSWGT